MTENLKTRLDFPNRIIQAQTVRSLVAAVLREKGSRGPISASSPQGPAWEALWEQCCSGGVLVSSACCDAVVLLVEQGHADHHYVLTRVLNLLPSARNVQGLIHVIGRMLQMDVDHKDQQTAFVSPYSIRNNPHPFITALENRVDCWPALLLEIQDCIQLAADRDCGAYVTMLVPFLRYLYCDPQRPPQHALLRQALLRVLQTGCGPAHQDNAVSHTLTLCLLQLVPHIQVDSVEAVLELCGFLDVLLQRSASCAAECWSGQRVALVLQLLCICQQSLRLNADCRPVLTLLQQLLPGCQQELPLDELLVGVAMLLLEAPAAQQTALLSLALSLSSEQPGRSLWIRPVLVLPVLQLLSCLTLTEQLADQRTLHLNQSLANRLLLSISSTTDSPTKPSSPPPPAAGSWYSELSVALSILRTMAVYPGAAADWLLSVSSSLSSSQRLSSSLCLVVTHVIMTGQEDVCRLALKTCQDVASADPSQVPSLIPVLLFKLSKEKSPGQVHAILTCLPNMGTHKHCVPMVLQTLHSLASAPKLRAVAMRLLTALWKKQERVYPDLQRLLGQQDNMLVAGTDAAWQQALSRAACLRDICRERPYQHGGDMLAAITMTLQQCSGVALVTPAALVLEGLQELCRAEVVDVVSMWRSLGPELSTDSRPLMIKATAELLALVPHLAVQSEEYQTLKDQVLSFLWKLVTSKDPEVSSSAFKALAEFPEESHTVCVFPEAARPPTKPQAADEEEQEEQEEAREEDLSVPASCYLRLMTLTATPVLPAFELFLAALVKQEMIRMPRGVYFSALRSGALRSGRSKTLSGIPSFIMKTYEKNKQPGLKPGLAAGLLFCYELPVQTDRDGRPISRFLASRSRSFQQTLTGLILEVSVQLSDWHRALFLPRAWRAFMSRAFHAVLQGRQAELEMTQKHSREPPEDLQYKQHCSWLWARDQLTDVIKAAIKDSPVVQGNSILAMSGLAAVVSKYESSLPEDRDGRLVAGPEFVSTASWFDMVLETVLSIISSSSYQPRGQVLSWFLHRSYSGENTASVISRSCASLSLCLLVPVLVGHQRDALAQVLCVLQAALPDSASSDDTQAVRFHSGLALGMVLCSVYQQRLGDVSAQKDSDLLSASLNALESCSFNPDLEYNTGCTLGLGLVLSTLCRTAQSDQHDYIIQTLERLQSSLEESSGQGRMLQEILAYCVACVAVSAFSEGLINASKAEEVLNSLRSLTENSQQTPGFSLALGLVIQGLSVSGHGKAQELQPRLLAAWIRILMCEGCPTMQSLAAVSGLVALVGSEHYLVQEKNEEELSSQHQSRLNEVIRAITQVISFSGAIGLQSNSFGLLAHLHLAHMSTSLSHSAVPQDFSYLAEKSIIRSIVDFLTEAGRKGPEFSHPSLVQTALTSLSSNGSSFQYPPINWSAILFPLMRLNFGGEVQHQCVVLAAGQAQSSQSASAFLGSWISPPLVHSLSFQTVGHLYTTLGHWMKHVSEEKLQVFLEVLGLQQFQTNLRAQRLDLCCSVLKGLAKAMALPNPPSHCWSLLCSTTEKIFSILPNTIQDTEVDLYVEVALCLSEMSDTEINRIAGVSETEVEKTCFALAYLTSQGRVPLLSLNDVIAGVLRGWPSQRVGWLLLHTFYQCRLAASAKTAVSRRMEWLLELMGHLRNVAFAATSVPSENIQLATDFLFQVFAAAVVSWSDHLMPLLLGLRAQWFPGQPDSQPVPLPHRLYGEECLTGASLPLCLLGLPRSLPLLMDKEPWSSQTHKFLDWLLSLTDAPEQNLSASTISAVKAALLALSSSPDFRKKAVWTKAYGW